MYMIPSITNKFNSRIPTTEEPNTSMRGSKRDGISGSELDINGEHQTSHEDH